VSWHFNMYIVSHIVNRKLFTRHRRQRIRNGRKVFWSLTFFAPTIKTSQYQYNNQISKNYHVPEIERAGGTLEERVRAVCGIHTYKLTETMVFHSTYCCWICFPKATALQEQKYSQESEWIINETAI
jgi:hypothetical protein